MLPKPLYEALPYLYFMAGLIVYFTLDTEFAEFSAALLAAAGLFVLQWRRLARKHGKARIFSDPGGPSNPS